MPDTEMRLLLITKKWVLPTTAFLFQGLKRKGSQSATQLNIKQIRLLKMSGNYPLNGQSLVIAHGQYLFTQLYMKTPSDSKMMGPRPRTKGETLECVRVCYKQSLHRATWPFM